MPAITSRTIIYSQIRSYVGGYQGGYLYLRYRIPPLIEVVYMALTVVAARSAKPKEKDYKLSDEKGMYLLVKKNGAKYWRMKYRAAGKEKVLALGVFPEITLAHARKKRDSARLQISDGIDPSRLKQAEKQAQKDAGANSFEVVAREWLIKRGKKSESGDKRLIRMLEKDLFPVLGYLPIVDITPPLLLTALRKIEDRGAVETAHRARGYAGQIFRYAVASGRAQSDPSVVLRGALAVSVKSHFSAIIDPKELGHLLTAIDGYQGTITTCAALKLSPLLFCRPGELRHLEWTEINWSEGQIELPAEKMKIRQPHIIPLSRQALAVLSELDTSPRRGKYVFPSARGASRPMSENCVRTALRTMGYDNDTMTPHGFRATARTLLDEVLGFRTEWIEQQLAHAVKDPNGRAYNRTKHLAQRKDMMQRWADYLDFLKV